ncbi:MAG: tetratricopeptide repeat protein, partial [Rhodobiaceae bacterium]
MLKDAYGNGLSTTSADARDAYDLGVRRFLGAEPGVEAAFNAAIEADADFALAHIGLARELQLRAERDRVNACIARADELSAGLTSREASHIHTSKLLLTGKGADARRHVYEHVKEWPRDVLIAQMCAGVFGLIGFSGSPGRESEQLSFLSGIAPAYGDNWWHLSQLAFAQLEVGQLEQA